ncbi:undecaprenyl-diphosphate phosphatase [Wenzhouxiangella sp. EGI_FJ10305]|uniref:undecaprenyl-diphosphate phosphatase n=1 Tax=Wenzhouxiangella sp. EGI_FJ10305 TaxID=3243768 RepID=UPI0035DA5C50
MDWLQTLLIALIQGLTEFLPVSSQAHLVLYSWVTGGVYQGLDFDIILHAGSLLAVVVYFRRELLVMARSWGGSLSGGRADADSRLAWWLIIGTLPAVVFGFLLKDLAENELRAVWIMAAALVVFGLLLGWADWRGRRDRDEYQLGLRAVLVIGFAQVLALIPGTSRSGITITAALFMGLTREAASRFSFLLSIPVITGATVLGLHDLSTAELTTPWGLLLLGFVVSAISTYACIHYFLAFIKRIGMQPFVGYRIVLGGLLLVYVLL